MPELHERLDLMSPERRQFALLNLAYHLYKGGQSNNLYRLIDRAWRDAHFGYAKASHTFAADVSLAIQAAVEKFPSDLAQAWRGILIYSILGETAAQVAPEVLRLLAKLGRFQQALNYASLIQDPFQRCAGYAYIAEVFLEREQVDAARLTVRKAFEAARAEGKVVSRSEAFVMTAKLALRVGDEETLSKSLGLLEAGEMGHWMKRVISELAEVFSANRRHDDLRRLLRMASRFPQDDYNTYSTSMDVAFALIPAFTRLGMKDELQSIQSEAEGLTEEWCRAQILARLVNSLAEAGDLANINRAAANARELRSPQWRSHLLGSIACAYHQLGEATQAAEAMDQALEAGRSITEGYEQFSSVLQLASDLARMGRYDEAVATAETIQKPQKRSDALRAVGSVALNKGDRQRAREMSIKALEAARLVDEEDFYDLHGPVETMVYAAEFLWDVGAQAEALDVIRNLLYGASEALCDPMYGPNALTSAMRILSSAGDLEGMEQALSVGVNLDDGIFRNQATNVAVKELINMKQFERALEVIEQYDASDKVLVAAGLLQAGERQRAEEMVNKMLIEAGALRVDNREASALNAVARGLAAKGMIVEAREVASEALVAAKAMVPTTTGAYIFANGEKAFLLSQIAETLSQIGDSEGAVTTAYAAWEEANPREPKVHSSIKEEAWRNGVTLWGSRYSVLVNMAYVLTRAGRPFECLKLAEEWKAPYMYTEVAIAVVEELLRMGEREKASQVAEDTWQTVRETTGVAGGDPARAKTVDLFLRLEDYGRALEAAESIADRETEALALEAVVTATADPSSLSTAVERALTLADKMPAEGAKVKLLCAATGALVRGGLSQQATAVAGIAYRAARDIAEGPDRLTALARCAVMMTEARELKDGDSIAKEALTLASKWGHEVQDAWSLLAIACSELTAAGGLNPALVSAGGLADEAGRASALRYVVKALPNLRDTAGLSYALEALRACTHEKGRVLALMDVAAAFHALGELRRALEVWQEACLMAHELERTQVLQVLEAGVPILADLDEGKTLLHMHALSKEVSNWWR